jgi:hypothetical protein
MPGEYLKRLKKNFFRHKIGIKDVKNVLFSRRFAGQGFIMQIIAQFKLVPRKNVVATDKLNF